MSPTIFRRKCLTNQPQIEGQYSQQQQQRNRHIPVHTFAIQSPNEDQYWYCEKYGRKSQKSRYNTISSTRSAT